MTDEPAKCLHLDADGLYCVLPVGHVGAHDCSALCRTREEAQAAAAELMEMAQGVFK